MIEPSPAPRRERLPRTVVALGLVSLFTDVSSEAIFPLLPAFLAALGASNAFIGLVEGAAELVANVLKYAAGVAADRTRRLKPLVLAGYGLSTLVRPLVAFASAPWHVLLVRVTDRIGKGVRTSPRDALIASVASSGMRARAFGFHRAMDHAGAALGTLFSAGLLLLLGARAGEAPSVEAMRTVFLWALLPGLIALLVLALVREPPRPGRSASTAGAGPLPPAFRKAIVALVLFAFANATDAFLLVKAARLGASPAYAPMLWLALHVIKASTATSGGRLADRYGRRNALAIGWLVYAVTWGAIGFAPSLGALFALTAVYGVSHGLVEGAERALVAELSGARPGRAFGVYNMAVGFAALLASTGFGAVWDRYGSAPAFLGSAFFALLAVAALLLLVPPPPPAAQTSGSPPEP